jgi:hypothetical protein
MMEAISLSETSGQFLRDYTSQETFIFSLTMFIVMQTRIVFKNVLTRAVMQFLFGTIEQATLKANSDYRHSSDLFCLTLILPFIAETPLYI